MPPKTSFPSLKSPDAQILWHGHNKFSLTIHGFCSFVPSETLVSEPTSSYPLPQFLYFPSSKILTFTAAVSLTIFSLLPQSTTSIVRSTSPSSPITLTKLLCLTLTYPKANPPIKTSYYQIRYNYCLRIAAQTRTTIPMAKMKPRAGGDDRTPWGPFVPKSQKEAEMEKMLKSMKGMPRAPGMKMYSREDLMNMQNFGNDDTDEDYDDAEEHFLSKLGKVLRERVKRTGNRKLQKESKTQARLSTSKQGLASSTAVVERKEIRFQEILQGRTLEP